MKKYSELIKIAISIVLFIVSYLLPNDQLLFLIVSYIIISYELYIDAIQSLFQGEIFNENFLMIIATLGAFFIGSYSEAVMVILLFQIGEYLSDLAVDHSKKKIISLIDLKSEFVNLKVNNEIQRVDIHLAKKDDVFIVKPGEKVPLDGIVIDGESSVDTSSLTGESIPRMMKKDSSILSGFVNKDAVLTVKATTSYEGSTAYKIIDMIENSNEKKGDTEKFIRKFSKVYTPIIVCIAFLLVIVPVIFFQQPFDYCLYKSLVLLVTSCPCALVISVPLSYFCGIGKSSHHGILVKGSNVLDKLSTVKNIAFDKTGTLTEGVFEVVEINSKELSQEELLKIVAHAEYFSIHPIAKAIVKKYKRKINQKLIKDYKEISGNGIECIVDHHHIVIGNEKLMKLHKIKVDKINTFGSISYIAVDSQYAGYIIVSDRVKDNANRMVSSLNQLQVNHLVILSGDHKKAVSYVAEQLKIRNYYAELLPMDKVKRLESLKKEGITLFVGDGMNDALVMKNADVAISMGKAGSDAAIEVSDIVIMTDDLEKIPQAIRISKLVKKTVTTNICFALGIKFIVLILALFNITSIWMAVFADVGVTLISILNSLLIMMKKVDKEKVLI